MIERGFEQEKQEISKLVAACIELIISWSMWFPINVFAMLELGFENYYFIESKNSLGSLHACWNFIFYFVCALFVFWYDEQVPIYNCTAS